MCLYPIRIKNPALDGRALVHPFIDVPCGKCPECLSKRRQEWVLRCKLEYQYCVSCLCLTLTYDEANVTPELDKTHIQKFLKRFRYYLQDKRSIKYYIVGEYGDNFGRPHWHCILFNAVLKDDFDLYRIINKLWPYGIWYRGDNKGAAYSYCMKYMLKDVLNDEEKPIVLISKGLGLSYLTEKNKRWHLKHNDFSVTTFDGCKAVLPRYLRLKLFDGNESLMSFWYGIYVERLKRKGIIKNEFEKFLEYQSKYEGKSMAQTIYGGRDGFLRNRLLSVSKIVHHM